METGRKKIILITQRVDSRDSILGFFIDWINEMAKHVEMLHVITLGAGQYSFPENVKVYEIGKEGGFVVRTLRMMGVIKGLISQVDGIFVHMCPEYVFALAPVNIFFKKPVFLWFVHRSVNWRLRLSSIFVSKIFTVGKESCRLKTGKINIIGHGINNEFFRPNLIPHQAFNILCVGRISPIKDQVTLINALAELKANDQMNIKLILVGDVYLETDKEYKNRVKNKIVEAGLADSIDWKGSVDYKDMPVIFNQANLLINLSPTGGKDKVVLEAMACGLPVLVANKSFVDEVGEHAECFFEFGNASDLSKKIEHFYNLGADIREEMGKEFSEIVSKKHSLENLIKQIMHSF
ncbi:glycosyltransferase family 4 protein [Patescibacteria group bacterium]|nr:glycosyltransferase family 4 protein [Patescibacteria group bacterium]MBU1921722.1 glycosyltransferase family 4 protein [Patescibacteria group bacterium]